MQKMEQLQQRLSERVEHCYQLAERHFGQPFPRPTISYKQRGKIAGSAHLQINELRFHPQLLAQNCDHFIEHVVAHEISHLLVWQLYGNVRPHGREWQQLMVAVYQLPPQRTHHYDTGNLGLVEYNYHCLCGPVKLSVRRHRSVLGGSIYRCRRCHQPLTSDTPPGSPPPAQKSSTHRPAGPRRPMARFHYRCDCGPQLLTQIRHHRYLRGSRYQCRRCKQPLHPAEPTDIN